MAHIWNARRLSLYQLEALVGRVDDAGRCDVLLLQEVALPHVSDWVTRKHDIGAIG